MSYGVVFSGGGALGAWEVGCYDAIRSRHDGAPPIVVTGASAGALNAVGVCAGMPPPQLESLWTKIGPKDVYRFQFSIFDFARVLIGTASHGLTGSVVNFLKRYQSIHSTRILRTTLENVFGGYFGSFAQSPIHFAISVTNLTKSEREYFYKLPVGDLLSQTALQNKNVTWTEIKGLDHLVDALLGSTALPVLFPPNGTYFDGGVLLNQPITPAIQLREPDILYVVIPSSETLGRTGDILEIAQTLVSTWISSSLTSQLERLRLVNKIRENRDARKLPVCVIRPSQDPGQKFGVNLLSFGERVGDLVKDGAAAANERINRFRPSDTTEATWY